MTTARSCARPPRAHAALHARAQRAQRAIAHTRPHADSFSACVALFALLCSSFGVTLFAWYFFNAVFAIFNKKTLNVFPYPWLLSWIQARAQRGACCATG
jgi:hypothetical protein